MQTTSEDLLPTLADSIPNAIGVGIFSVRFLQSDPAKRATQGSGSVVVSVAPADVSAFGSSIRLFSHSRQAEGAYSSNPMTQDSASTASPMGTPHHDPRWTIRSPLYAPFPTAIPHICAPTQPTLWRETPKQYQHAARPPPQNALTAKVITGPPFPHAHQGHSLFLPR